jgi:PhnB protein
MTVPSKPEGYSSVSPYLVIEGAQQVIDFLKEAFGATELRRYDMPDGSILHAEVRIDDTVIMMGEAARERPLEPRQELDWARFLGLPRKARP